MLPNWSERLTPGVAASPAGVMDRDWAAHRARVDLLRGILGPVAAGVCIYPFPPSVVPVLRGFIVVVASLSIGAWSLALLPSRLTLSAGMSEALLHLFWLVVFFAVQVPMSMLPSSIWSQGVIVTVSLLKLVQLSGAVVFSNKLLFFLLRFLELAFIWLLRYEILQVPGKTQTTPPSTPGEERKALVKVVFTQVLFGAFAIWRHSVWQKRIDPAGGAPQQEEQVVVEPEVVGLEENDGERSDVSENRVEPEWLARLTIFCDIFSFCDFVRVNLRHRIVGASRAFKQLPMIALVNIGHFLTGKRMRIGRPRMERHTVAFLLDRIFNDGNESDDSSDSGGSVSRVFGRVERLVTSWW